MSKTEQRIQGLVERIENKNLEGHVFLKDDSTVQLTVELWSGNQLLATTQANDTLRTISSVPHGFSFPLSEHDYILLYFNGLEVRVVETGESIPFVEAIRPELLRQRLKSHGCIASLHSLRGLKIKGTALSLAHPEKPATIVIIDENNREIGRATCSVRTQAPLPAGVTTKIGFDFYLPETLIDGNEHGITLLEASSMRPLLASAIRISGKASGQGTVDTITQTVVSGWACLFTKPDCPAIVDVFVGDELLGSSKTSIYRPDTLGIVEDCALSGFDVTLARPLTVADRVGFRVVLRDTEIRLALTSEATAQLNALNPPQRQCDLTQYKGYLDTLTMRRISGWAVKLDDTDNPLVLNIYINGFFVSAVTCDLYREDVRELYGTKGYHGFHLDIPPQYCTNEAVFVSARYSDTGLLLPGSPETAKFGISGLCLKEMMAGIVPDSFTASHALPSENQQQIHPKIGLIVLNQNGSAFLEDFFSSFKRINTYPHYEIIVLDHGSNDNSLHVCEKYSASMPIRFIDRKQNYSFSASNNFGAKLTDAELLFIVNNDIIFSDDILSPLAQQLEDSSIAAVGLRLLTPDRKNLGPNYRLGRSMGWNISDPFPSQHVSVKFSFYSELKTFLPYELPLHDYKPQEEVTQEPCLTAAALLVRKSDFLAVGGFEEGYFYGYEDVDLCLKLQTELHKSLVSAHTLVAYHHRSASRSKLDRQSRIKIGNNFKLLENRFGLYLLDKNRKERLDGNLFFRNTPLRLAFLVSDTQLSGAKADFFTALELSLALQQEFKWEIYFLKPSQWYDLELFDVAIAMLHSFNPLDVKAANANPNLLLIAWARNWFEGWLENPGFEEFDQVWASSEIASQTFSKHLNSPVPVIRIATNEDRFAPRKGNPQFQSDYCFTGSYFKAPRQIMTALRAENLPYSFKVFGHNWNEVPFFAKYHAGSVNYAEMPTVYHSTKLVLDDANHTTKDWGAVNSRVFDALAAGKVVITNSRLGSQDAFDGLLPSYETREELEDLIEYYLEHAEEREKLAARLQNIVKERHTYKRRAHEVKAALTALQIDNFRMVVHAMASPLLPDPVVDATSQAAVELFGQSGSSPRLSRTTHRLIQDEASVIICRELRAIALDPEYINATKINVLIDLGGIHGCPAPLAALFDVVVSIADTATIAQALAGYGDAIVIGLDLGMATMQQHDMPAIRQSLEQAFPRILSAMRERRSAIGQGNRFRRGLQPTENPAMEQSSLATTRILFFPDYTETNPYQDLLYRDLPEQFLAQSGTIEEAQEAAESGENIVFHLHWSAAITGNTPSRLEAENRAKTFFEHLDTFLDAGGRLALTLHNILLHEIHHLDIEIEVCRQLCARAHIIHAHSKAAVLEAQKLYPVPTDRTVVAHHGNFIDVYPNTISRDEARQRLELAPNTFVLLFFGQICGYNGLKEVIDAFSSTLGATNKGFLIIAGKPVGFDEASIIELTRQYPNIGLVLDDIAAEDIQIFFNAADFAVLPYNKELTSSIYLALSYGVPVITPAPGLVPEVMTGPLQKFLYNPDDPNGLAKALILAEQHKATVPALKQRAFARAQEHDWASTRQAFLDAIIRSR